MRNLLSNSKFVKAIASALMLIALFSLATYYALYTPPEPPIEASKLIILTPSFIGPMGVECILAVQAVSDEGLLDKKRDDLVRISIDQGEHAQLGISDESVTIWSESIDLKLKSGQGVVRFVDHHKELVRISVEWRGRVVWNHMRLRSTLDGGVIDIFCKFVFLIGMGR